MIETIRAANARKLDLGTLMALRLLLRECNLSHVARAMNMTQPAMSQALARLRRIFEDPLLVRDGARLVRTPRGATLLNQLDQALPDIAALFGEQSFDPASSDAVFRIGIIDHAGQVLMPRILQALLQEAPSVRSVITMIPNRQTDLSLLDSEQYDLHIGWLPFFPQHWHHCKLIEDEVVLIGSPDHPRLQKPLTIEDFVSLDHVALESDKPAYPDLVDSYLKTLGFQRRIVTRVSHFAILPELIAETRLVAMFPRRLAESFARRGLLRIVTPPIPFPNHDLSMGWHPRTHAAHEHVWLRDLISKEAKCDHS